MIVRNTLVAVKLDPIASEKKVGAIVVNTNGEMFNTGTVISVGPGNVASGGGRSETFDLTPGHRVLVKHQDVRQSAQGYHKTQTYTEYTDEFGEKVGIFEQSYIVAIL
jgi:co-chaperonin GroES (HSP10)